MNTNIKINGWEGYVQETERGPYLFLRKGKSKVHFLLTRKQMDETEKTKELIFAKTVIPLSEEELTTLMAFDAILMLK